MTLTDQIALIIDAEIKKKVSEALTEFAERVAISHRIPLSLLLRDMPSMADSLSTNINSNTCLGVTDKKVRCSRRGIMEGYCKGHFHQKQKIQPVAIIQGPIQHTHGIPPFYKHDCPACISKIQIVKKPLIDCSLFSSNE